MKKVRTNVSISKNVLERARKHNIIISSFLEIKLVEYLALLEGNQSNPKDVFGSAFSKKDEVGSERFELSTSAMSRRRHNH